jgi:osmoprotectant transport system permease protein
VSAEALSAAAFDVAAPPRRSRRERLRLFATPLVVVAAVAGLYLYLASQELDVYEARLLTFASVSTATWQHLRLALVATALVVVIAVPLGVLLTRPAARRVKPAAVVLANVGQAAPALGILVLLTILFGIGFHIALAALVIHAVLPVLRNTIVGIEQVDRALVEAARGMGLSPWQVLRTVELPLAVPVMLAGLRTALVICVGLATIATFVNAGGLGDIIVAGIKLQRTPVLIAGGVLTAAIALALDWLAGVVEEYVRPRGI